MEPALKKSKIDTASLPIEIYGNILNYYDKESDIASLLKLRTVNQSFRQEIKRLLASSLEGSIYNFIFDLIHLENEITNFDKEQLFTLLFTTDLSGKGAGRAPQNTYKSKKVFGNFDQSRKCA